MYAWPIRALPSFPLQNPPQLCAEFADGKAHGHAEHETPEYVVPAFYPSK
jgi:hypothetical protein